MAIDQQTCDLYTTLVDEINKAILDVLKKGKQYRIAGRELEHASLSELQDMLNDAISKKNRFCKGNGGATIQRGTPSDT